jgi:hypothetical protein
MFHFIGLLTLLIVTFATTFADDVSPSEASDQMLFAVAAGQLETVKSWLKRGAMINYLQDSTGSTALMIAAKENHINMLNFLLENNAKVNIRDSTGGTALFGAANNGWFEATDILLKAGIDVNAVDMNKYSALHFASFRGRERVIDLLLSHPTTDRTIVSKDGLTPFILACKGGDCDGERAWVLGHISDKLHCDGMPGLRFDCTEYKLSNIPKVDMKLQPDGTYKMVPVTDKEQKADEQKADNNEVLDDFEEL